MEWELKYYNRHYLEQKKAEFGENELITRLLLNRKINKRKKVDKFLNSDERDFYSPFLFENMNEVVNKILKTKKNKEKITIFGDYDVDGTSGTAYLVIVLRKLGLNVDYYILNRSYNGSKINDYVIKQLQKRKTKILLTVDTSITCKKEYEMLKSNGIELIITDHHRKIDDDLDVLTINPKISKNYPEKNLSGSGVAFKLACAIYEKEKMSKKILYDYIDLIMIGTVADVVPMTDENRIIIKKGLSNIKKTKIKGLRYIINSLNINPTNITTNEIGFYIAPVFNALGRVDNSKMVVDFYTQENDDKIFTMLEEMKIANKLRRHLEEEIYNEIEEKVKKLNDPKYIFMKSKKWHPGIIGVVCSRISIKYNIPVVLVSIKSGYGKASCRSIEGINIFNMLKEMENKFERYGGHDLAAGFLVLEQNLYEVETLLKNKLYNTNKNNEKKVLTIDTKLPIEYINKKKLIEINKLAPFGLDNLEPNFLDSEVRFMYISKFGVNNRHFKGMVKKNDRIMSVIGYNLGNKLKQYNMKNYEIVYTPVFKSVRTDLFIELKIKDFR